VHSCCQSRKSSNWVTNGFECYRFAHCCLPELDRSDINIQTTLLGKNLGALLLISSMTGGTELARLVNTRLASVAQRYRLAMGIGSQRIALEMPLLGRRSSNNG
jgi:isopentenyl-diphosphate delta-isomerase